MQTREFLTWLHTQLLGQPPVHAAIYRQGIR